MWNKRTLIFTLEIAFLVVVFLIIIWPMTSLFIWSIAETWYWPHALPQKIGLDYWQQALGLKHSLAIGAVSIVPAFFLSLGIAIIVVVISMLIAIPAGYALAKYRIPFGAFILFLFLMPNAFPQQPIFVNLLRIFTRFDLAGTVPGVILVHILVGLVFGVWITSATFRSIPPSMEEAARSVGASLPFVNTLPMTLYSSSGYNMQFASVIAIVLLIPSILFMALIQKVLKAEYVGGMG
jgi:ABC-type spermidine/putrescine transport system permease subunit II